MLEAGNAAGTVDQVLILYRYICNCAIRRKMPGIKTNPIAHGPRLHVDNTTKRFLSANETPRLAATLDHPRHRCLKPIVLLLLPTGPARRGAERALPRVRPQPADLADGSPKARPGTRAPCRSAGRPWIRSESAVSRR